MKNAKKIRSKHEPKLLILIWEFHIHWLFISIYLVDFNVLVNKLFLCLCICTSQEEHIHHYCWHWHQTMMKMRRELVVRWVILVSVWVPISITRALKILLLICYTFNRLFIIYSPPPQLMCPIHYYLKYWNKYLTDNAKYYGQMYLMKHGIIIWK